MMLDVTSCVRACKWEVSDFEALILISMLQYKVMCVCLNR